MDHHKKKHKKDDKKKHKKHKKHKHSNDKKKRKHDDDNVALVATSNERRKRYYSSSDLDSSDDDNDKNHNNNMLIPYNTNTSSNSIEGLKIDRRGDKDLAYDIGIYRLEIPIYCVTVTQGSVSSKHLSNTIIHSNSNDTIERYFHNKNRKLVTDSTISRLRLRSIDININSNNYDSKPVSRGLPLELTLGFIPTTHYNSADDEIMANTNSNVIINVNVNTDTEFAEKWLIERNKYISRKIRDNPNNILSWLGLISLQKSGLIEATTNTNNTNTNTKFLIYEKQKSILKECIEHFNIKNNTDIAYYMHLLMLMLTQYYEPSNYRLLCDKVVALYPYQLHIWMLRLKLDSESFETSILSSVRSSFHNNYQKFTNDVSNRNATNNMLSFLTASISSPSSSLPSLTVSTASSFATLPEPLRTDMELASIDMISLYANIENGYGYCERAISIMIALIEINLLGPSSSSSSNIITLFEEYWESEYPRATDVTTIDNHIAGTFNGWIDAGKPRSGWKAYENLNLHDNEILNNCITAIDEYAINNVNSTNESHNTNTNTSTNTNANTNTNTNSNINDINVKTNDIDATAAEKDPALIETYVYSRLHGYRIKITNEDTGLVYRKILGELDDDHNTSTNKKIQPKSKSKSKSILNDRYKYQYIKESILTSLACRPLRAYAECDMNESAANPDRVVLIDDIRPYLVAVASNEAKMRLIIRTLQHLGLVFPYDPSTASSLSWFDEYLEDCTYDNIKVYCNSTSSSSSSSSVISGETTVLSSPLSSVCTPMIEITVSGSRQHELAHQLGQTSKLDIAIKLMMNIIYSAASTRVFSCKVDIYNIAISLISIRAKVELAYNITDHDTIINKFRTECRRLVEHATELLPNPHMMQVDDMDFRVWAAYVEAESRLGQFEEALKVGNKLLASLGKCLSLTSASSYDLLLSLSQVPGALKLYYLVLAIILTSPSSSTNLQRALTLLVDLGLGGSNYNASTKKKGNTNTKSTTSNTNIMIAIENLNKLSISLTTSLGSKVNDTNNGKDIRVNVCACYYDNTNDVFYSTSLFAWLVLFGSITMNKTNTNTGTINNCLEAADDVYKTIIDVLNNIINPSNDNNTKNITGLFSKLDINSSFSSSSCVITLERLLVSRVQFLTLSQNLKLGLGSGVKMIIDATVNGLKYFPANKQLLSVLLASSSSSLNIHKAFNVSTLSCNMGINFEFELELGEKIFPLLIHIRRANLIANQEHLMRSDYINNNINNKVLMSSWREDSVSCIRIALEKLLDDPSIASSPSLWLFYLRLEVEHGDDNDASKIYYRALQACPHSKKLWMFGLGYLRIGIEEKGLRDIVSVMEERGIFIRTQ